MANHVVWKKGTAENNDMMMGTTLTAMANTSDTDLVVLHVGDSRLFRLRAGRMAQLTQDHTVVADLVRDHELDEREVEAHPFRFVLTRAIGVGPQIDPDFAGVSCQSGDRFLLCTDGLHKVLRNEDIKTVLNSGDQPQTVADLLVAHALDSEAEDNVTAVVLDVV